MFVIDMKVFLQRNISDAGARYEVADDRGELKYRIRGKVNPTGESIRIRDVANKVVGKVRRIGFSTLSAYRISIDSESIYLHTVISAGKVSIRFRSISFSVRGDVRTGSYDIIDADNSVVCAVSKDYAKGCITLTINTEERELFCIAMVACIDNLKLDAAPTLQMT